MSLSDFEQQLRAHFPDCQVSLQSDGNHYQAIVIGECFAGLSKVRRQQMVYAALSGPLADGSIHALHIKAHTADEWAALQS
ncbi:MAG: BolA/IbaG family iron-sulfur metabolism protein [Gammaproteobacteria bacterium]|nr:BolA/IbaG family iron-sulfur metabolism protein [Gammaproteobacteria bacterium]